MRTLYFNKKDLAFREKELREQFWHEVEDEQLKMAKKRVEEALEIEFSEGIGAGEYERSVGRKMYRGGCRYRDLQTWGGRLWRVKVPKGEKGYKFKLLKPWARHVRAKVLRQAKMVYRARDKQQALNRAKALAKKWSRCEPKAIRRFMRRLDATLTYMDFPTELWFMLKSTNHLERYLREWRRRLRSMGALQNSASCDRILYALVQEYNSQKKRRTLTSTQKSELYLT